MAGRSYERLSVEEFGAHLLATNDLDPIYVALHNLQLEPDRLGKWLMAYWMFYSAPFACFAASKSNSGFWEAMTAAAYNETPSPLGGRWPRAKERRHCRGQQAINCLNDLMRLYADAPGSMPRAIVTQAQTIENSTKSARLKFATVTKVAEKHALFGPWIGFKVADMLDRLAIASIDFDEAAVFMFKDPYKAALMLYRQKAGIPENAVLKDEHAAIHEVVEYLCNHFADTKAPPLGDRPVGLQEVETVLCKWKSHMNGHYPLNNDLDEIRHALQEWEETAPLVSAFLSAFPKGETDHV